MPKSRLITNSFIGADEYFAYEGLVCGYTASMTLDEVYEYIDSFMFKNETVTACQNCFLLGFLLGQEIQNG